MGNPVILDTLEAGRIKFVKIDIQGLLQLETGEHNLELKLSSLEDITLDEPYSFTIESRSMVPPKMIVADFAVSNGQVSLNSSLKANALRITDSSFLLSIFNHGGRRHVDISRFRHS